MEAGEAFFTTVMIGACSAACLAYAFFFGTGNSAMFAFIALAYFVFTFIGYLKAYGDSHYTNIH